MCGRFTRYLTWREIHYLYRLTAPQAALNVPARSDIRPTTDVVIIREGDAGREAANMRWGLIPAIWPDPSAMKRYVNHNARSDKLLNPRGWWKRPFETKRCLIPASGYYEWKDEGAKRKTRYYFVRRDGGPITFAGMWDFNPVDNVESCTMITTEPSAYAATIHDRMPAILAPEHWDEWLAEPRFDLLVPAPDDLLEARPVRSDIMDEDTPEVLAPPIEGA